MFVMIRVDKVTVHNIDGAIRGMRNPMNSWSKSDSHYESGYYVVGDADMELMKKLYKAGNEHRKYLRQIFVCMDITAPLQFLKEADTYKVGTTTNSCSTMHKLASRDLMIDDFSHEHLTPESETALRDLIRLINVYRKKYIETKDKEYWWQMIQLLPSSYNQKRTMTLSYENVMNIINQRTGHKLDEWNEFVGILKDLPYIKEIRGENDEERQN